MEDIDQMNVKFEECATKIQYDSLKTDIINLVPQEDFRPVVLEVN